MKPRYRSARGRLAVALGLPLLLLVARPPECAGAQGPSASATTARPEGERHLGVPRLPANASRREVRVSLAEHRLYVVEGGRVVWAAPIGTGTGDDLVGGGQRWDFSTPTGRFRIQYKEKDPVWFLPDWVFVERGEPIPAFDAPERRVEGELGAAALYLTREIAIHGTDRPDLLGQPISHGCIRMSNDDVLRLYDELEVGTPVIIH